MICVMIAGGMGAPLLPLVASGGMVFVVAMTDYGFGCRVCTDESHLGVIVPKIVD